MKSPKGSEGERIRFSLFTQEQAVGDAAEGRGFFSLPGAQESLRCTPTFCSLPEQGRGEGRGCVQLHCSLKLQQLPGRREHTEVKPCSPGFPGPTTSSSAALLCSLALPFPGLPHTFFSPTMKIYGEGGAQLHLCAIILLRLVKTEQLFLQLVSSQEDGRKWEESGG